MLVSVYILSVVVTRLVAAFSEVEGDAIGADGWRPLKTIARVIPLLFPAVLPLETLAAGAVCAATPFFIFKLELCAPAGAVLFGSPQCRCADVPHFQ